MAVNIEAQITLVIKTNSLQRAVQICKLASFDGHVEIDTSNKRSEGEMKQAVLNLLQTRFSGKEFTFSMAASMVKDQFKRGGSTTRRILRLALGDGIIRQAKKGIYAFVDTQISETAASGPKLSRRQGTALEQVAPNVL